MRKTELAPLATSQMRTLRSRDPEATKRLSGEKASAVMVCEWPASLWTIAPVSAERSSMLRCRLSLTEAIQRPSRENATR